jgi:hypothetical protein
LPGAVIGPNGARGNSLFTKAALQTMFDDFLMEHTLEGILALNGDEKRKGKLSVAKGLVLARIIAALESGGGQDFDRIMDRSVGKVAPDVQINIQQNFSSAQDDEILERWAASRNKVIDE